MSNIWVDADADARYQGLAGWLDLDGPDLDSSDDEAGVRNYCPWPEHAFFKHLKRTVYAHFVRHSNNAGVFECQYGVGCAFECVGADSLKLHLDTHAGRFAFECADKDCGYKTQRKACADKDCGYKTQRKRSFEDHMRMHGNIFAFECVDNDCGYKTQHKHSFEDHMRTHAGIFAFECADKDCGYKTQRKRSLKDHMRMHAGT
ncbi:hypothetical protein T492DRAFT_970090 [Pavlovales sp. CCMP2436]|nr:hypothetical protein T492DRAFT_970090 [Pavlovales sp. CCMP2436]